jgi:hypothetical protein
MRCRAGSKHLFPLPGGIEGPKRGGTAPANSRRRACPSEEWLEVWSLRLGTKRVAPMRARYRAGGASRIRRAPRTPPTSPDRRCCRAAGAKRIRHAPQALPTSPQGRRCRALLSNQQRPSEFPPFTVLGEVLGQGEDGVQTNRIILLSNGRVVYPRHVHIDERPALRPTLEGGKNTPPSAWHESLLVDPDAQQIDVQIAAPEREPASQPPLEASAAPPSPTRSLLPSAAELPSKLLQTIGSRACALPPRPPNGIRCLTTYMRSPLT